MEKIYKLQIAALRHGEPGWSRMAFTTVPRVDSYAWHFQADTVECWLAKIPRQAVGVSNLLSSWIYIFVKFCNLTISYDFDLEKWRWKQPLAAAQQRAEKNQRQIQSHQVHGGVRPVRVTGLCTATGSGGERVVPPAHPAVGSWNPQRYGGLCGASSNLSQVLWWTNCFFSL